MTHLAAPHLSLDIDSVADVRKGFDLLEGLLTQSAIIKDVWPQDGSALATEEVKLASLPKRWLCLPHAEPPDLVPGHGHGNSPGHRSLASTRLSMKTNGLFSERRNQGGKSTEKPPVNVIQGERPLFVHCRKHTITGKDCGGTSPPAWKAICRWASCRWRFEW